LREVLQVGQGIQSSKSTKMTRQDWDDIRSQALKQFDSRRSTSNKTHEKH
jgi:hypothetical protein